MEEVPREAGMDERFAVSEDISSFLRIERLFRRGKRLPGGLEHFLPARWGTLKKGMSGSWKTFSLYLLIENIAASVLNSQLLDIETLAERESQIMDLPPASPVISSFMVSTSYDDAIVEFRKSLIRTSPFGLIRLHTFRE